jgi:hypothetical protein
VIHRFETWSTGSIGLNMQVTESMTYSSSYYGNSYNKHLLSIRSAILIFVCSLLLALVRPFLRNEALKSVEIRGLRLRNCLLNRRHGICFICESSPPSLAALIQETRP